LRSHNAELGQSTMQGCQGSCAGFTQSERPIATVLWSMRFS
jgi:hypothetical protein